jgi:hypothetical protein
MAAESGTDIHHSAPRCLLRLFDAATGCLADWSECDSEAERWGIEVRGLSLEDLTALIEGSTRQIPTTEHRSLHQEEGDFAQSVDVGHKNPSPLRPVAYLTVAVRNLMGSRMGSRAIFIDPLMHRMLVYGSLERVDPTQRYGALG